MRPTSCISWTYPTRCASGSSGKLLDPMFVDQRARIAELGIRRRLMLMSALRSLAEAGFLVSYGVDATEVMRLTAVFVDRILRGTKPADLPIEQPSQFDLVVNARTAKTIGVTIPPAILLQARKVIN